MFYTGVGSRETPPHICLLMTFIAYKLAELGWVLRSGDAIGADKAFYEGVVQFLQKQPIHHQPNKARIYLPKQWFIGRSSKDPSGHFVNFLDLPAAEQAYEYAEMIHPNWPACKATARILHARNMMQVMGDNLNSPSKKLICWAPISGKSVTGGTRTAWEAAKLFSIPRSNLAVPAEYRKALDFVGITEEKLLAMAGVKINADIIPLPIKRMESLALLESRAA